MLKRSLFTLGTLALSTSSALADGAAFFGNTQQGGGTDSRPNAAVDQTLGQSITGLLNYFLGILGLIAVAFLIYAGILMVTAGGNDEQVTKAKTIITYASIGILVVILSWTIVRFVSLALG